MDWSDLAQDKVADTCKQGNKLSGSIAISWLAENPLAFQ